MFDIHSIHLATRLMIGTWTVAILVLRYPYADGPVQSAAHEHLLRRVRVNAEDWLRMSFESLEDRLGGHVPKEDCTIFTARGDEGKFLRFSMLSIQESVVDTEATTKTILGISVGLVCFCYSTVDVVPEAHTRVKRPGQYIFAIGREANRGDGGVIFVD